MSELAAKPGWAELRRPDTAGNYVALGTASGRVLLLEPHSRVVRFEYALHDAPVAGLQV